MHEFGGCAGNSLASRATETSVASGKLVKTDTEKEMFGELTPCRALVLYLLNAS